MILPTKDGQDTAERLGDDLEMPISEQTSGGTVKDRPVEFCQVLNLCL